MTFYYDNVPHSGTVYARRTATGTPSWMDQLSIQRVVIDSSMCEYGQDGREFQYLFCGLSAVTNFEGLTNLRTGKATSFYQMFYKCKSATELDVSRFKTSKVSNFECMFRDCDKLETVDLSSFSSASATSCSYMFNGCYSLTTIFARPAFDLSSINSVYTFTGCSKLVGGNGTKATSSLERYMRYQHIDEPGNPGYFTFKPYTGCCVIVR